MPFKDISLLWRLRRGEREAFEAAVREHYASVYRQHYLLTHNPDHAADLTQETFLEAWRSLPGFVRRSSLRTWLHAIAVRVWNRKRAALQSLPALETASEESDKADSPERIVLRRLQSERITCALRRLPEEQRIVLVLHYRQEMTHVETAKALGIPVGTIKSRLSEGLKRLRRMLDTEEIHG